MLGYGAISHGSATKEESYISKKERKFFQVHGPKISLHAVPCDVPSHGDLTVLWAADVGNIHILDGLSEHKHMDPVETNRS